MDCHGAHDNPNQSNIFLPRDALVHSAILRLHVVRPSVCDAGISGSQRLEILETRLIARKISPTPLLFVAQRTSTYPQGNMGKFGRDYRGGVEKSGVQEHKSGNISETHIDRGKLLWRLGDPGKSQTLFRTVPSQIPYGLPFPKIGGSQPHSKTAITSLALMKG